MKNLLFCLASGSPPVEYAGRYLMQHGISVTDRPEPGVTHLLLPVPVAFSGPSGSNIPQLLRDCPKDCTVLGGRLPAELMRGRKTLDFLEDPFYQALNADLTARCALRLAGQHLPVILKGLPVLIIGFGRIGKRLAALLQAAGASVTVAARKKADRAMAVSSGLRAMDFQALPGRIGVFRLIFNTVPAPVMDQVLAALCRKDCVKIELASSPGMAGAGILDGRKLPGRMAPESAGQLIGSFALQAAAKGKENVL